MGGTFFQLVTKNRCKSHQGTPTQLRVWGNCLTFEGDGMERAAAWTGGKERRKGGKDRRKRRKEKLVIVDQKRV